MILIRYILICIVGYLVIRTLVNYGKQGKSSANINETGAKNKAPSKKVSKKIGEYIDYEEIKRKRG